MSSLPEPVQPQVVPAVPVNAVDWGAVRSRLWRLVKDLPWAGLWQWVKSLPWAKIGMLGVKAVFWLMAAVGAFVIALVGLSVATAAEGNSDNGSAEDDSSEIGGVWRDYNGNHVHHDTGLTQIM